MIFTEFTDKIATIKSSKLGGIPSQFKLAPEIRIQFSEDKIREKNPKEAAVLILIYPNTTNTAHFFLTKRATYKGTHSAQISFTGGKSEKDEPLQQTALRETLEEVGIPTSDIKIIRQLTEAYIPPSNFLVTPFLAYTKTTPKFIPNYEVDKVLEISLQQLLNTDNLSSVKMNTSYMKNIEVPCFMFDNQIVWGATAMILAEFKDLLKEVL